MKKGLEEVKDPHEKINLLEQQLERCNKAFFNIIERNKDGILVFDKIGKILYANRAALDLFGKEMGDLLGEQIDILINPSGPIEMTIVHHLLGPINIELNIAETIWNNTPARLASLRNVTEHVKTQKFLERLSHYDYLTDLSNRVFFEESLKKSVARSIRYQKPFALLYLDLDGFKNVNDVHGHVIGDKLLVYVANLLKSAIRGEDLVSRLGGDEFGIIIEGIKKPEYCTRVAQKILNLVSQPVSVEKKLLAINFSIGIAMYPNDADTIDELIKHADSAMYAAKRSGKGRFQFYSTLV